MGLHWAAWASVTKTRGVLPMVLESAEFLVRGRGEGPLPDHSLLTECLHADSPERALFVGL